MNLAGSRQVGLGKDLLQTFDWQKFSPHPEWATYAGPAPTPNDTDQPQSTGIPGKVRLIYCLRPQTIVVHGLDLKSKYRVRVLNPMTGDIVPVGTGVDLCSENGDLPCYVPDGITEDWLVIVEDSKVRK